MLLLHEDQIGALGQSSMARVWILTPWVDLQKVAALRKLSQITSLRVLHKLLTQQRVLR